MRLIVKLLGGQYRRHWFRTLLALSAVATSVTMVIVLVGQQTATVHQADEAQHKLAGSYDLIVNSGTESDVEGSRRRTGPNPPLPPFAPDALRWMRANPDVKEIVETCEMVVAPGSNPGDTGATDFLGVSSLYATTAALPPRAVIGGRWLNAATDDDCVVVDSDLAKRLGLAVGRPPTPPAGTATPPTTAASRGKSGRGRPTQNAADAIELMTVAGRFKARVVGLLDSPGTIRGITGLHVTPAFFARLAGRTPATNRVLVALKDPSRAEAFIAQFDEFMAASGRPGQAQSLRDFGDETVRFGAARGTGPWFFPLLRDASAKIAVVAAFFIIFNTFSMGLEQRTRQLAMLRAIGLTRGQVGLTVFCDALAIATVGWLIGMGVSAYALPRFMQGDSPFGRVAVTYDFDLAALLGLGAATAYGSVLLATALPVVLAMRKRPLESMTAAAVVVPRSAPWWMAALAVVLIGLNPLAALVTAVPDSALSAFVVAFSFVTAIVGFTLIIPALLRVCEPLFVRVVAPILVLNPRMLQRHLSANLWRTVGCVAALMVGLGLYIVVNIWGRSMAVPFMISPKCPDAVVTLFPGGMPESRLAQLPDIAGVRAVLPMILEHPMLADLPPATVVTGIDFFGPSMIYVGCDADALIDPDMGMLPGKFLRGNPADARRQLQAGNTCLITDNLYRRFPQLYDVGKTIKLDSGDDHRPIAHIIVGVVEIDGWHQFSKRVDMRRHGGRAGGFVIVSPQTAKAAYPDARFQMLWFKLNPDVKPASLERPVLRLANLNIPDPDPSPATAPAKLYCRILDARRLVDNLNARIDGAIQSLATYPLWALLLASVAVVNTMFASVRARSWEIGILRSVGLTRGQLLRQVLAEGLLIGLLACAVSLLFGLLTGYTGIVASCLSMNVTAPFVVPWASIAGGLGLALALCLVATAIPALLTSRRETLSLLRQGRYAE